MKKCTTCGLFLDESKFSKISNEERATPRGGLWLSPSCRSCRAEKRKPGIEEERRQKEYLLSIGLKECSKCCCVKPVWSFSTRAASIDGLAYKCKDCYKIYAIEYKKKNPDSYTRWASDKKEANSERFKRYRESNKDRLSENYRRWATENKEKRNASTARRNAIKLKACPPWANLLEIDKFYAEARRLTEETGLKHEVDHYYPLQGELVCGLHCESNLQVLTKTENLRKKNRMPEPTK